MKLIGRDDLAEAGIAEQLDIEAQIPVLERVIAEAGDKETEMEGDIQALHARKRELKAELQRFADARQSAEAGAGAARRTSGEGVAARVARQIRLRLIEQMPEIIRESVRPMERIEGIRIYQVDGLSGGGSGSSAEGGTGSGNLADQVVNSALRYRARAPLVEALLKELGLEGKSLDGLTSGLEQGTADALNPGAVKDENS